MLELISLKIRNVTIGIPPRRHVRCRTLLVGAVFLRYRSVASALASPPSHSILFDAILIFFFWYGGGEARDRFLLKGRNWRNSLGGNFIIRGVKKWTRQNKTIFAGGKDLFCLGPILV